MTRISVSVNAVCSGASGMVRFSIVNQNARNHGVVDDFQLASLGGWIEQIVGGIEEGGNVAAAATGTAIVTGGAPVVFFRENGTATGHNGNANAFAGLLQQPFAATGGRCGEHILTAG